jgi:hypothetical protein
MAVKMHFNVAQGFFLLLHLPQVFFFCFHAPPQLFLAIEEFQNINGTMALAATLFSTQGRILCFGKKCFFRGNSI